MKAFYTLMINTVVLSSAPNPGHAEDVDPMIEKGLSLYNSGDYLNASLAFRDAYRKDPAWRLHLNIGRCELPLKKYDLAMEEFSAYLKGGGDEITKERKDYATEQIQFLTDKVASLTFTETEPLDILVDDVKRASTPMSEPLYVLPGSRRVVFENDGKPVFEKIVVVQAEEVMPIERPKPKPEPMNAAAETQKQDTPIVKDNTANDVEDKRYSLKPIGITLLAVSGATLIPGIITGAMYASDKNDLEKSCPDKKDCSDAELNLRDSANNLAVATSILLPVGGVLAVTGIVLTVVGHRKSRNNNKLGFAPLINDNVTGLTVSGRF